MVIIMTELRIRVKPIIKEFLESIKDKNGFSINFQVNFAIFKYLILDVRVPYWKLDDRPDPHYETINKMPDEANELPLVEKSGSVSISITPVRDDRITDSKPRGDKC